MPYIIGEKRKGSISVRQGKNGVLIREMPFYLTVQGDSQWQPREEIIFNTPGMPLFGVVYVTGMTVKSINAEKHDDDVLRWDVTITCSSEVEEDQESKNNASGVTSDNPVDWIPIATVRFEPYEEVLKVDVDGKKWVNSAKKAFETGFSIQKRIAVVPFSQFEPISTTLETIMDRCDTINSATYKGKAAKKLLLNVENATIGTYSGTRCWRVDYSMRYKKDDWRVKQLDVGWGHYVSTTFTPFLDTDGNAYLGSLNGSGAKVANEVTDDPATLYFEGFSAVDFNSFLKVLFT